MEEEQRKSKLNLFEFLEVCSYFENFSAEDKALAYGIASGTPQYFMQLDGRLSIEENIKNTHLNPSSFIFEEPTNLPRREVREPTIYNAIITAIAIGSSRMNEISAENSGDTSVCATHFRNLIALGIIKKNRLTTKSPPARRCLN